PPVARRSPAMTTPSAYRMATTVVPCVTPAGGSPPPPPPSTGRSVPTRFNSSLKLGPGSPDGNSGRLIRRETLPAAKNYDSECGHSPPPLSVCAAAYTSVTPDRTDADPCWDQACPNCLLSTLLDVVTNEIFRVLFEHFVNFVQQFIELGLDLFALLGRRGRGLFDFFLLALSWLAFLLLSLWHGYLPGTCYDSNAASSSAGVAQSSNNVSTWAAVPLSGSIMGTRRRGSLPRSNTRQSQLAAAMLVAQRCRQRPRK